MKNYSSISKVKDTIRSIMSQCYPSSDRVAQRFGTSRRTLLRWLERRGLTYTTVVDEVRMEEAKQLITDSELKLYEIAAKLGFTEASSFTRAFSRWTGVSPRRYRKQTADPFSK